MGRALAGVALFSAAFFVATRACLRAWQRAPQASAPPPPEPLTFFRPLKPGEPSLAEKLTRFVIGTRPGDRILLGTTSEAEHAAACAIREGFPEKEIVVVPCEAGRLANPKINKLAQMEPFAGPERWLALDSDTLCDAEVLDALRADWAASGAPVLTAPYVFVRAGSPASRLDAAATVLGLWPGVALLRATGRAGTMFGACLGVTAPVLRSLGGWAALGDEFAEDNALGRRLAAAGHRIHLAPTAVPVDAGSLTWREAIVHQHRVHATYHRCDPAGALGLPLTYGIPLTLAAFAAQPRLSLLAVHAALVALRAASARELPGQPRLSLADIWLTSLAEPVFWTAGLVLRKPHWKGWVESGKRRAESGEAGGSAA